MLKKGTILEPRFDAGVEHAVVIGIHEFLLHKNNEDITYEIKTVKSGSKAILLPEELHAVYNPIGQSDIGRALFCED